VIEVEVEGRPAPKGSRIQGVTKSGKQYTRPASRYEAPWVAAVKRATQIVVRHATPIEPPYAVELEIRIQKAKNRRKGAVAWPTVGDVDKLARSTIDGLAKGGALEDDRHVTALTVRKRFTRREETPGVTARVTQDAQMQDLSAAA